MPRRNFRDTRAGFKSDRWHDAAMDHTGRFAPSPTGELHLGSLLAALGSWLEARAVDGRWLLRIEDIDPPREVPGSAESILAQLYRLGMEADDRPMRQSTRSEAYTEALQALVQAGHAYPCACTRSDLAATGGIHPAHCIRPVHEDGAHAWRLRVPRGTLGFDDRLQGRHEQDLRREVGDFVLRRADGLWAYQLAVVVDDAAQDVTDVVRGADLLDSTPRQILLQRLLGLPTPRYLHLPVLVDSGGQKFSKSTGASALPHDALVALRAALALLGQHEAAAASAGTPAALLDAARRRYRPDRLPRTRSIAAPQSSGTRAARTLAGDSPPIQGSTAP